MDQENSAVVRIIALSPLRATMLTLAAVIVGVGLSLFLGSSSAHAAENDGSGDGSAGPLGSSTIVDETLLHATDTLSPVTAPIAGPVVATVISPVVAPVLAAIVEPLAPVVAPIVAPILAPVNSIVTTALDSIDQLLGSTVVGPVLRLVSTVPLAAGAAITGVLATSGLAAAAPVAAVGESGGILLDAVGQAPSSGGPTGAVLTSAPSPAAGVLAMLFVLLTIALLGARRRTHDDALPSSPVFETDTSPA